MEKKIITPQGVNIYTYANNHLHSFYISLFAKGGSVYEDERSSGITHFLEHALIRNVNARMGGELYRLLDIYGLEFNASTYSEMVHFYISGAKEHFALGAKIICALFDELVLGKEEIDTERLRIKAELREGDDKNSLANFSAQCLYPDTTLRLPILGTNKSLDAITRSRLSREQQVLLARENIFFYLTGNVADTDEEILIAELSRHSIPSAQRRKNLAPIPAAFGKRDARVDIKNADYVMLRFAFDMDMTRITEAESDLLYDILFTGYNSRFFMEMSEKRGICYDITGGLDRYLNIGALYFTCEVKLERLEEAVRLSTHLLRDLKQTLLDPEQIINAPYVGNAYLLYDDVRELNFTFAYDCHMLDSRYSSLEDRRRAYAAVTPERIREVARLVFTRDNCSLTLKGPKKKISADSLHALLCSIDE